MSAYATLKFLASVFYGLMALWLVIAGVRRLLLEAARFAATDFAAYTSISLGAVSIVVGVVTLEVRRHVLGRIKRRADS